MDRVLRWDGAWYTVGDGGLQPLARPRAPTGCRCAKPEQRVVDADAYGEWLYALDRDGVWTRRAGFESIERIVAVQGTRIAVHHPTFAVAQPEGVQLFARSERGPGRPIGTVRLPRGTSIRATPGPGDSYRVGHADATAVTISATADAVTVTARFPAAERTEIGARVANLVALVGPDPHEVRVCRIGDAVTLHR